MLENLFSLAGRTALVTGGSRGLGKMIAQGFLAQGAARVYITARKAAACEATARELTAQFAGECIALPIDISTVDGAEKLAAAFTARRTKARHSRQQCRCRLGRRVRRGFRERQGTKVGRVSTEGAVLRHQGTGRAIARPAAASAAQPAKVINIASIDGHLRQPAGNTYPYAARQGRVST